VLSLSYPLFILIFYLHRQGVNEEWNLSFDRGVSMRETADKNTILHENNVPSRPSLDVRAVLGLFLKNVKTVLTDSYATVSLTNKETGVLELIARSNENEHEWNSIAIKESDLLDVNDTFAKKVCVTIRKVRADMSHESFDHLRKAGITSYLWIPLVAGETFIGALTVFKREQQEFSEKEVQFLSALANQAAASICNAQLCETGERQVGELEQPKDDANENVAIISHELKTPLQTALTCVSLIKDGAVGNINAQQERLLNSIVTCLNDQSVMINSLLNTAVADSDSIRVGRRSLDLKAFLAELRLIYENPLRKELFLGWDYPPDLPVIKSDGHKLKLILQNLINNAIKFTPSGRITIFAQHLAQQKEVKFVVADTGIGIPRDSLAIIFDKFRQLGDRPESGGIGLGLYIVKKYTHLLGGRIAVESELGKGSTFTLSLPYE
jgi:signal transduction histidine kinase